MQLKSYWGIHSRRTFSKDYVDAVGHFSIRHLIRASHGGIQVWKRLD